MPGYKLKGKQVLSPDLIHFINDGLIDSKNSIIKRLLNKAKYFHDQSQFKGFWQSVFLNKRQKR